MKKVIIMRSPSGGGKSTKARELKRKYEDMGMSVSIHSTDDLFIQDNVYKSDPSKIKQNHDKNFDNFRNSLRSGINIIIVDNTNINSFEYERYVNEARRNGYEVEFSQFGRDFGLDDSGNKLSVEQLKERVRLRAQKDPAAATPPENVIDTAYSRYRIIDQSDYEPTNESAERQERSRDTYRRPPDSDRISPEVIRRKRSDVCVDLIKRSNNDKRKNRLYNLLRIITN